MARQNASCTVDRHFATGADIQSAVEFLQGLSFVLALQALFY